MEHNINDPNFSPWDLLPAPIPSTERPDIGYFYDHVIKQLIPDTVRIMNAGIPIDLQKVSDLEEVLDEVIDSVTKTLAANPIIQKFQEQQYSTMVHKFEQEQHSKKKPPEHFLVEFKQKHMVHRSYFMYEYCKEHKVTPPSELLPGTTIPKWSAAQIKRFAGSRPVLQKVLDGDIHPTNKFCKLAMQTMAEHKSAIQNKRFDDNIRDKTKELTLPAFNPGSPDQKHGLLTGMLGYESEKLSDAYKAYERKYNNTKRYSGAKKADDIPKPKNKYSWDRDNIEMVMNMTTNEDEKNFLSALIDFSFSAIVKNNFVQAFYEYTVNGRLHGQYKLFGAKTLINIRLRLPRYNYL